MDLDGTTVLVCNCEGSMAIDGDTLSKACGAKTGCSVATSLCRSQSSDLAAAMLEAKDQTKPYSLPVLKKLQFLRRLPKTTAVQYPQP